MVRAGLFHALHLLPDARLICTVFAIYGKIRLSLRDKKLEKKSPAGAMVARQTSTRRNLEVVGESIRLSTIACSNIDLA